MTLPANSNTSNSNKMKNFILTTLSIMAFAVSAFAAPTASAGSNMVVTVGEAIRLDGSASTGYATGSQRDGTWSTLWQTGDGVDAENVIKCPHVYTAAGVYTATLTVKDSSGASSTASIQISALDILPAASGNIQTLTDSGNAETNRANLQAAIDAAAANSATSEVRVPAGFVFNDPMILRARTATSYVTIRAADLSNLPQNVRVTANDKAKLFRMNMRGAGASGYNNGVEMSYGAQYYRIIGLEIRKTVSETNADMFGSEFVNNSVNQNHLIIDRTLLDGNGYETRKGAVMNGRTMSLINSSVLNIKAKGVETKAVANWVGGGPLAVVNCRLEAASINSLVGGSPVSGAADVLDGYEFRGNYVWKNPAWNGVGYNIKNLWELKHGYNTVAVGNIFENNYSDGQSGEAILIKSQTDEGCAYCEVRNVDFRSNKILNTRAGFNVINMQAFHTPYPAYANHIRFVNNFWQQTHGRGNLSQGADYFEVIHNTFTTIDAEDTPVSSFMTYAAGSSGVPDSYRAPGYKLLNNLAYDAFYYNYALVSDTASGTGTLNGYVGSDWDMRKNVIGNVSASTHPADNFYPASVKPEFVDYAGGNFNLKSNSPYKGAATDGKDIGADMAALNSSTAPVTSGVWNFATTITNTIPAVTPAPAIGYESDVAPRLNGMGDGKVTVADFIQIGRFVAGLDAPKDSSEFQRADSAPRASKGDGVITVSDYIQAARYAAGIDPIQTAGGPSAANVFQFTEDGKLTEESLAFLSEEDILQKSREIGNESPLLQSGAVRVVNTATSSGQKVLVSIETDPTGTENGFGFTLNYDSTKLNNPLVLLGTGVAGATLIPNTQQTGKVGVVIALPSGQTIQPGTKQIITILFDVPAATSAAQTALTFSDAPVVRQAINANAENVPTTFTDGLVQILAPTAATVTAGGQVTTPGGRGVSGARVSLIDSNGATQTVTTNSFGYYHFTELVAGETYVVSVRAKRLQFTSPTQVRTINGDTFDIDFTSDR